MEVTFHSDFVHMCLKSLSIVGDRAFLLADSHIYDSLPVRVSSQQWRNNRPCRPCNAGGPRESGGPCANPQKNFVTTLVGYAVHRHAYGSSQFTYLTILNT